MLQKCGYNVVDVPEGHLCCGSAGTYSILQPRLSASLLENKLAELSAGDPDIIATAKGIGGAGPLLAMVMLMTVRRRVLMPGLSYSLMLSL